jgi:CDGSH-type Zn-finger protein
MANCADKYIKDGVCEIDVDAGVYAFCKCGQSKNKPFCDGSHQGSSCSPKTVKFDKPQTLKICSCGKTKNFPFCDGSCQE